MPTLEWIGKDKVINHHQEVPFKVLDYRYTFTSEGMSEDEMSSENKIIHGDNLEALKALLPQYEGKIKCIYIDPPYNTGNEKWIYNDNVNHPKIKKWLGEVVGAEGEDLSRHDKWLCMMYPRLKLMQRLLATDGIIAVSIDDNEVFNLGEIMNEIFGAKNRLACAPWLAEPSGGKERNKLRSGHEYILIYCNGDASNLSKEERSVGKLDLKDSFGAYRKGRELRKWGANSLRENRPNLWFGIKAPNGEIVYPYKNDGDEGNWRWGRTHSIMKHIIDNPQYAHWELCKYDDGVCVNGKTERWVPFEKIRDAKRAVGWSSWLDNYGYNSDATAELKKIFGNKNFETPKPSALVSWIVSLYDNENDDIFVLDSFAGSGTTAHAVLNLNKQDGGNRKFILIEMEDYAENITAERIKRVFKGYSNVEGTGGDFNYYELGQPLLLDNHYLNEEVSTEKIREYVFYMETKQPLEQSDSIENSYYLGKYNNSAYYFYYEKNETTTLNYEFLTQIKTEAESYIIYADKNTLSKEEMSKYRIVFKKIPRDIAKL